MNFNWKRVMVGALAIGAWGLGWAEPANAVPPAGAVTRACIKPATPTSSAVLEVSGHALDDVGVKRYRAKLFFGTSLTPVLLPWVELGSPYPKLESFSKSWDITDPGTRPFRVALQVEDDAGQMNVSDSDPVGTDCPASGVPATSTIGLALAAALVLGLYQFSRRGQRPSVGVPH